MTKNEKIRVSIKQTKEMRQNQTLKVYEFKINRNKLNSHQKEFLQRVFLEAKWFYNDILQSESLELYDTKKKSVTILNKEKEPEQRNLQVLGSQIKQSILQRTWQSIKSLSTKKKNGRTVGKLKFKSQVYAVPLKQYGVTYKFVNQKLKLQKCKTLFYLHGWKQIPEDVEFANANLIYKPSGYYLHVVTYTNKQKETSSKEIVGIDFGIKDDLTLSNGVKFRTKIAISKTLKRECKRLSKKKKGSRNYFKQKHKIGLQYEQLNNKKKDMRNKLISYLKNNYSYIAIQDENIKGWHSGLFGRQVQQSILGGLISELKKLPQTTIIDRFFPSTKLCNQCGTLNNISLSERIYTCECGYTQNRDVHSAMNILLETVPTGRRDFKPVEFNTSALDVLRNHSRVSVDYETGRYNSLELC